MMLHQIVKVATKVFILPLLAHSLIQTMRLFRFLKSSSPKGRRIKSGIAIVLFMVWIGVFLYGISRTPSEYDFLPYALQLYPGSIGDCSHQGLGYPPGLQIVNPSHPIISTPIRLIWTALERREINNLSS